MAQIVAIFEAKDYSEEDSEIGLQVMSLMNEVCFPPKCNPGVMMLNPQQMQEYGAPPTEIMGELPPGVALGADGLPQLPQDCRIM